MSLASASVSIDLPVLPDQNYNDAPQTLNVFLVPKYANRWVLSGFAICALLLVTVLLGFGREHIRHCLLWLDTQEKWIVSFVFVVLYAIVSFPLTWGYILLNLACGYHFGLVLGVIVANLAASAGIVVAHVVMRRFFFSLISSRLVRVQLVRSALAVLRGTHAFKVVAISRLTPIPFGLQNAVFAVSEMSLSRYVSASALGLFPTQVINVYLGTTVRSMEGVLQDDTTSATGYAFLIIQVVLSVALMMFILRQARKELQKAVQDEGKGRASKYHLPSCPLCSVRNGIHQRSCQHSESCPLSEIAVRPVYTAGQGSWL